MLIKIIHNILFNQTQKTQKQKTKQKIILFITGKTKQAKQAKQNKQNKSKVSNSKGHCVVFAHMFVAYISTRTNPICR